METKTLLVYMPFSWPSISKRVFKAFAALTAPSVQEELAKRGVRLLDPLISDTFPLDRNRNEAVTQALSNKYAADYIFFADGDNIWPSYTLPELLDAISDEYPVVSGLYWRKTAPYKCVQGLYSTWEKHELKRGTLESIGLVDKRDDQQLLFYKPLEDYDTQQRIDVAGCGALLAKTEVFRKIDLPYFGYFNAYSLGGDFTIQHASEEMLMFAKFRQAGIKTLVVPSVRCGHEVTKVIGSPEL